MKKNILLYICVISLADISVAEENSLDITLDVGYFSQYLWYGIDLYADDHSATQSSITASLYDTSFGFKIWNSLPNSNGLENSKEFDYIVFYCNSLWNDSSFAVDYTINYIYMDIYDNPSKSLDTQEFGIAFSWPNLCPAIVPHYYIAKLWPTGSKVQKDVSGWIHCLGFSHEHKIPGILPEDKDLPLIFVCDLIYNDGYGLATADHDWSHAICTDRIWQSDPDADYQLSNING